jgi:transketolase
MKMKNQRTTYGETLVELGRKNKNIVVLEADLSRSTMGTLFGAEYPDRFFEMGIAEANMASTAAGLSLAGKIPFMASFAVFATGRCYDQIRTSICIPGLNVKICGSSAGLSDFGDGSTHQTVEDIAIMRVLPNMQVFCPADSSEAARIINYMEANSGPMYMRLNRMDLPEISGGEPFVPGRIYTLKDGKDVAVFACGVMVSRALEAAERLEKEGISVKVVNVPSIKPIDSAQVAEIAGGVKAVVTAEEHSVLGGLGGLICEIVSELAPRKIVRVGIQDKFGSSARDYETLLNAYGLNAAAIEDAVKVSLK